MSQLGNFISELESTCVAIVVLNHR